MFLLSPSYRECNIGVDQSSKYFKSIVVTDTRNPLTLKEIAVIDQETTLSSSTSNFAQGMILT